MVEGVSNPTHVYAKMVMAVKIVVEVRCVSFSPTFSFFKEFFNLSFFGYYRGSFLTTSHYFNMRRNKK